MTLFFSHESSRKELEKNCSDIRRVLPKVMIRAWMTQQIIYYIYIIISTLFIYICVCIHTAEGWLHELNRKMLPFFLPVPQGATHQNPVRVAGLRCFVRRFEQGFVFSCASQLATWPVQLATRGWTCWVPAPTKMDTSYECRMNITQGYTSWSCLIYRNWWSIS
jgi:hypothetical protein